MNKRGIGLSMETLVVAIIVLVVLFVVVGIFVTQSGKYVDKYSDVTGKVEEQTKGCSLLFGRYCASSCYAGDSPVPGNFEECRESNGKCCEKKPEKNA